jgi:hypothetical protein
MPEALVPVHQLGFEIDETLILEMAKGLTDPKEIAEAWGITGERWDRLSNYQPFIEAVTRKKLELAATGVTFKIQAGALADALAKELFRRTMQADVSVGQIHEVFKTFAKLGDLEPKPSAVQGGGTGWAGIQIVLNQKQPEAPQQVIDIKASMVPELNLPAFLRGEPVPELPEIT